MEYMSGTGHAEVGSGDREKYGVYKTVQRSTLHAAATPTDITDRS